MSRLKTVLKFLFLVPLGLFAAFYCVAAIKFALLDDPVPVASLMPAEQRTIAIFGASGTAGDGILKAALADNSVSKIHVITRRMTPRIDAGVDSGKLEVTLHQDYLDYAPLRRQMAESTAVYWAIGTSSVGVDEATYALIHVDFPRQFLTEWMAVNDRPGLSLHYISSSDISADSTMMWAREKVRAERTLFELGAGSNVRVLAYRPDYIGPTTEEAHLGQTLLYHFFAPVKSAVRATEIGEAMLEATLRSEEFVHGDRLSTGKILRYSDAYRRREGANK